MWGVISGLIGAIGTGVSGFFGFKGEQAKAVQDSLNLLEKAGDIDSQAIAATAQIITAEANNGSWLASNWRPLFMTMFGVMIVARWFGYVPANLGPQEIEHIYGLFELGLTGYIGSRGIEKIITSLGIQRTLRMFIEKKLS